MRKLLKYEMRALNRRLFPIYIGMLGIAILNCFFGMGALTGSANFEHWIDSLPSPLSFAYAMFQGIVIFLFFGILVGMLVVWLLTTLNRFRKGLLGEEGYLMFTLPVTTGRLMGAKLLGASIHLVLTGLVAFLSMFIMVGPDLIRDLMYFDLPAFLGEMLRTTPTLPLYVVEIVLLSMLNIFSSVLQFYFAMAIGHLSNRHRTLCSVAAYIGISTVVSMLTSLSAGTFLVIDALFLFDLELLFTSEITGHIAMLFALISSVIPCLIYWFGTRYILKNRLNLE